MKAYLVWVNVCTRVVSDEDLTKETELALDLAQDRLINTLSRGDILSIQIEPDTDSPYGTMPGEYSNKDYEVAESIKDLLIKMAINDEIPMDMNDLSVTGIAEIISSYRKSEA